MADPLFVIISIACVVALVVVAITIREAVYDSNADAMFDAPEVLVSRAEDTPELELVGVVETLDDQMTGFRLVKAAPFVQYVASDNVPWRFMREILEYGVALGYTSRRTSGSLVERQLSTVFSTEDIVDLWPSRISDDAEKRMARLGGYGSMLRRFVLAHPEYAGVEVRDPFVTSGAKPYVLKT
ncbi:MAG: hypothetical protein ACI364_05265 [Coriobacteriales bacterium]